MVPPTPTTSSRLLRAAAAERAGLARHRERLLAARASLREELDRVEASLDEIKDRDDLLARLAPAAAAPTAERDDAAATPLPEHVLLRGPEIRKAAVRVVLDHLDQPEALHYRQWYELLTSSGYVVAGKDPRAVFLTQISRSPVIGRGTQTGVYYVDKMAPKRLRKLLAELHAELRSLASEPNATTDLAMIRERRAAITAQTGKTERALEEAEALLSHSQPLQQAG